MTRRVQWMTGVAAVAGMVWIITLWMGSGSGNPAGALPAAMVTQSAPATMPAALSTTQVSVADSLLPDEYSILETTNPFGRGHAGVGRASAPEASLVFKGAAATESTITAFFEDLSTKQVRWLGVGDAIGRGQIKSIDLDTVVYTAAGKTRPISVGQNLEGVVVPPTPAPPPPPPQTAQPPNAGPQPGMPGGPGGPGNPQQAGGAGPPAGMMQMGAQ